MAPSNLAAHVFRSFSELAHRVEAAGFAGYEFDDFLDSPIIRALAFDNLLLKRIFIQIGERSPVNLRPLLGIAKHRSTKASGFFARGYLHAYQATGEERFLEEARKLLDWLSEHYSHGYSGHAWGNAFDFASRGGFIPRERPSVVWTSHINRAFVLAHTITGDARYGEIVNSSAEFILNDLERHEDASGVCIAYAPGLLNLIHNSNLLAAVALLRSWSLDRDVRKYDVARRAFAWSLARMERNGSWRYGVGERYRWVDNHHTAYIIDCLLEGRVHGGDEIAPAIALEKTVRYWEKTFFRADGAPKYYNDRTYPLDIQAASQAIETFARLSEMNGEALSRACSVLSWANLNLRRRDGFYMYRRGRLVPNRLVSIHWGQATMLAALGALLYQATLKEK